jgi:hypothetical protein
LLGTDGGHAQVVDDQDGGFLKALEQFGETAVGVSLLERTEELGGGKIRRAKAIPAGLNSEGAT